VKELISGGDADKVVVEAEEENPEIFPAASKAVSLYE